MTSLRSRVVVALLLPVLGFSLLVLPGRETLAACRPGTPCIENFRATPFETVSFPKMDWTLLGEVQGPASKGHDSGMLSGDATVTLNDLGAQTLGLTGSQVSGSVHAFPHNPPLIFARDAPGANELRIDVIKIERTGPPVKCASIRRCSARTMASTRSPAASTCRSGNAFSTSKPV